ncbi:MAG: hypothetical protein JNL51_07655 [Chitinophagaceae bacterium]|nr:hypothetical protein [Chitinophagaceae bacterium]
MIGIFRQKNPGNGLLILVYGLILKFNYLLQSQPPLRQAEDHYLYTLLLEALEPLQLPFFIFGIISFLLLFIQAVTINKICIDQKMLPKPTYLPGMAYILITSLYADWNYFSAPLIINTLLIVIVYRGALLYNSQRPLGDIFNIGALMGLATLVYQPAIVFVLMLPVMLFIMRPFRVREWLLAFLGVGAPYYFLALEPLFTNRWVWRHLAPSVSLDLPAMPSSLPVAISILLLLAPFIIGGYFVQRHMSKMLIQIRKAWSLILTLLIISLLITLANGGSNYLNWIFCLIPLSLFHAAAYFYPAKQKFPLLLHWVSFAYALFVGYWLR